MKKLMSLGGNFFQATIVKAAKRLGYYVISVDYLPNNPAHRFADEYHCISTLDKDSILKLARKKNIDGIVSYASDVSAPTAAYVAETLGLQTNPLETIISMTRKDLFHPILHKNNFIVPNNEVIKNIEDTYRFFIENNEDILIKPVNSSGSKGVTRVKHRDDIEKSFEEAKKYSRGDVIIAEKFIERDGYQIAGDAFIIDGEIRIFALANEHFDKECNPLVPIGESFPVRLEDKKIEKAKMEIQRALNILGYKNGAVNLDFMFDKSGNVVILELGPRNGGNLITDAFLLSSGIDLAEYTAKLAVGDDVSNLHDVKMRKCFSSYIWHSIKDGKYEDFRITDELNNKIVQSDLFIKKGDEIHRFDNGGFGIGAAILKFESEDEMLQMMDDMNKYYNVLLK